MTKDERIACLELMVAVLIEAVDRLPAPQGWDRDYLYIPASDTYREWTGESIWIAESGINSFVSEVKENVR